MKTFMIALALGLSACSVPVRENPVANYAEQTVLDEKSGIAATEAYTAASTLGRRLVQAGLIDKAAFKAADNRGYAAVQTVRKAYLAGNSKTYDEAVSEALRAVVDIRNLVR